MIIPGFGLSSGPEDMSVSGIKKADFTLNKKYFGFENGFTQNGSILSESQLAAKGQNLFAESSDASKKLLTVTGDVMLNRFDTNQSAYNIGRELAAGNKLMVCDFENRFGDYGDPETLERVGNFLKGAKDGGARVGEFLYAVWNDVNVWNQSARTQLLQPVVSGIGTKIVPSLGMTLGQLYGFNRAINYGVNYVTGRQGFDPRSSVYNFVYKQRVHAAQRKAGLMTADCISIGYLWGGCDSFQTGKPPIRHRIYLEAPYSGYVSIFAHNEESLKITKGAAMWSFIEGEGAWYWNPRIRVSETKNDVVDILYSGYPHCDYIGDSHLPASRPDPIRSYPYLDGLSQDVTYEAASEIVRIEDILDGGEKTDADFSYKIPGGEYINVTKPADGTGIVEDYERERPLAVKIVKGKKVVFALQHPAATEGSITKMKLSHQNKTWFVALNGDEPKLCQFTL
jgi:hypothetical protein